MRPEKQPKDDFLNLNTCDLSFPGSFELLPSSSGFELWYLILMNQPTLVLKYENTAQLWIIS